MNDRTLFFFGAFYKGGHHVYSTTTPSCCIPTSYCHLSTTIETVSIIVVKLQDSRAVFQIFIALLRFSFDCPFYHQYHNIDSKHWSFFFYVPRFEVFYVQLEELQNKMLCMLEFLVYFLARTDCTG